MIFPRFSDRTVPWSACGRLHLGVRNNLSEAAEMFLHREALATLQQLIGGNREDLADLVREFIKEGQSMLANAQAAAEMGDGTALRGIMRERRFRGYRSSRLAAV